MGIHYIDIIIIAAAIVFGIIGYCKGFLKPLNKLLGAFLALIAAFIVCVPIVNLLWEHTPLDNMLIDSLNNAFFGVSPEVMQATISGEGGVEQLKTLFVDNWSLPGFLSGWLASMLAGGIPAGETVQVCKLFAILCTYAVFYTAVLILLFIVIRILVFVIKKLIELFLKDNLLKIVDRIFGIAFGVLKMLLIVFVVFAIGSYFIEKPYGQVVKNEIMAGSISKPLYESNPVKALLDRYVNLDDFMKKVKDAISGGTQENEEEEKEQETPEETPGTEAGVKRFLLVTSRWVKS